MYEVEVKVRADHDDVRELLGALGAESLGGVEQEDTYYDAPHREFAETDEALRVRREIVRSDSDGENPADGEEFAELTYKGPLVEEQSKTRREVETRVADGESAGDILAGIGFDPAATVRKERERFAVGGFTVTLDSVDGLGEFVEVETEVGDEESVEAARKEAFEVLDSLGLDPDDQIRTSYLGLLLEQESGE